MARSAPPRCALFPSEKVRILRLLKERKTFESNLYGDVEVLSRAPYLSLPGIAPKTGGFSMAIP